MKEQIQSSWSEWAGDFSRRHPWILLTLLLLATFAAGPLMIAATRVSAVLYRDF